jgi:hypothetical protein
MQFECHLIFHQRPSKLYDNHDGLNLVAFDGISNDTQIAWNLNYDWSISSRICCKIFSIFKIFLMNLFESGCQDCQDK